MKKTYEKAEIEIFMFADKDVLTASVATSKDNDNSYVNYSSLFTFNDFFGS